MKKQIMFIALLCASVATMNASSDASAIIPDVRTTQNVNNMQNGVIGGTVVGLVVGGLACNQRVKNLAAEIEAIEKELQNPDLSEGTRAYFESQLEDLKKKMGDAMIGIPVGAAVFAGTGLVAAVLYNTLRK